MIGALPGGCGSTPLPRPLLPVTGLPDPYDAKAGSALSVRTSGATYATFLTKDLRDSLSLGSFGSLIGNLSPGKAEVYVCDRPRATPI